MHTRTFYTAHYPGKHYNAVRLWILYTSFSSAAPPLLRRFTQPFTGMAMVYDTIEGVLSNRAFEIIAIEVYWILKFIRYWFERSWNIWTIISFLSHSISHFCMWLKNFLLTLYCYVKYCYVYNKIVYNMYMILYNDKKIIIICI